jgi:2-oxoglutarate ferredoxin oxidoreductase subunit alpha
VLAPGTAAQAFDDGFEAFNLADRYHCPVIVLSDLALAQWLQSVEGLPFADHAIDRGRVVSQAELDALTGEFERYRVTQDGISPRALPGMARGQFLATGVEHASSGKV